MIILMMGHCEQSTLWGFGCRFTCNGSIDQDVKIHRTLSAETSKALRDFYLERDDRQRQFEDIKAQAEAGEKAREISIDAFTEDWNASQFWVELSSSTCWNIIAWSSSWTAYN